MLVLSLFPGIGLLDRAFEAEGFCVVRGPDPLWGGDIRSFHPLAGRFDGIIGGPPCQSFSSLVHLVRANGHEPRFGNLIPEYERCVTEAQPEWFLMENVPAAPEPVVPGYGVKAFLLDNSALCSGDGWGQEQRRVRRFSFGLRGRRDEDVPSLMRWIDLATFLLPDATRTVTALGPDHLQGLRNSTNRHRRSAVVADLRETPVALGGSGKPKLRTGTAAVGHGEPPGVRNSKARVKAVSGSNGGNGSQRQTAGAGNNGKGHYKLADACRLQGLPEDFLADAPFTAEGKLKAVANGVPIGMGRAIAKAIKEALTFVS